MAPEPPTVSLLTAPLLVGSTEEVEVEAEVETEVDASLDQPTWRSYLKQLVPLHEPSPELSLCPLVHPFMEVAFPSPLTDVTIAM